MYALYLKNALNEKENIVIIIIIIIFHVYVIC